MISERFPLIFQVLMLQLHVYSQNRHRQSGQYQSCEFFMSNVSKPIKTQDTLSLINDPK